MIGYVICFVLGMAAGLFTGFYTGYFWKWADDVNKPNKEK